MSAIADLSGIPYDELHKIDYISVPGIYEPSPKQIQYHTQKVQSTGAHIDQLLFAGSAGPGKSMAGLGDVLPYIFVAEELARRGDFPRGHCQAGALFMRRESAGLKRTIRRSKLWFRQLFGNKAKYNETDMEWTFPSGFTLKFGHCKNPDDYLNFYSEEYVFLFFDELSGFTKEQFDQLYTRVRSDHPVFSKMCKTRAATNPDPGWVREYFVDPAPTGHKLLKRKIEMPDGETEWVTRYFLPALLADNPNKAFVKSYHKRLAGSPEHIRQAQLEGNWYITANSYFSKHWRQDMHVIRPFRIPGDWPVFRALDWGYKTFGVCLWAAVDPEDNIVVFREFTFRGMDGKKVAERIKEIEMRMGYWVGKKSKLIGPADTNLWGEYGSADSHAEQMMKAGVNWVKADKKSRAMNAQRFIARLDDHDQGLSRPGIMFFDSCVKCISTIPALPADPDDSEVPLKCDQDHWSDTVQQICAYRTPNAERFRNRIARKERKPIDAEEAYFEKQEKLSSPGRGRLGYGSLY